MTENVDQFNDDELHAPAWLNAQFLGEILSTYKKDPELKVTDLEITPGTAQGDHYASVMFRAKVEYTTSIGKFSKSLIIKTMPEVEGAKKDMLAESHLFETEIGMYSKVLPEFERILREAGDSTKLYVPCIYHSLEPRQVIVFEDLVPQGYSVMRDRSPTLVELKAVYSKLAKLHAISMKVLNEQPEFLKEFKYGMCGMPAFLDTPMVTSGMPNFLNMLDKTPELLKYKPYFAKINESYMQRQAKVLEEYRKNRQPDGFYVLSHGDFHLRNMMFKNNKESGEFDDVMLLDFQISNIAPPTVDLIYSVYLLMDAEQRWNLKEELINYYFSVLNHTLRKIKFKGKIPSQDRLWELILHHKYYDFFLATTFLPNILAVQENTYKLEDIIMNDEIRQKTYFSEKVIQDFSKLLPEYEKLGYFKNL
ncbi:uncharacterized protein LOC108045636 [Drosophila rhopaloa]|uniref:CHK kinase-like domain-containing protein n=1 Tax=Drosophila rhopaloa TaxID=1041015 RepID=A0ABM5HHP2_DRORH|nr:uncharacterized protein LOC108045636 [Drosophila rhopaloa]